MTRPATRILALLELLQAQGQTSGSRLAARLGVDGRTLRRYVTRLEEMGIPIAVEHGRHGGYGLVPGYKLPPLIFNDEEALALSVGLRASAALGLSGAGAVDSARAKLERVLPTSLRARVRAADQTIALALPRSTADHRSLGRLTQAAQERRRVHIEYVSANGTETARDFDPYGLAWRGGCWYLAGHCHARGGLRTLRVDRVRAVRVLDEGFVPPAAFDTLAHVARAIATVPRAHTIVVRIRGDREQVRRAFFEAVGVFEDVRGGVRLHVQADDLDWFARELARLPFPFVIEEPARLRARLCQHAKTLLNRTRETP